MLSLRDRLPGSVAGRTRAQSWLRHRAQPRPWAERGCSGEAWEPAVQCPAPGRRRIGSRRQVAHCEGMPHTVCRQVHALIN